MKRINLKVEDKTYKEILAKKSEKEQETGKEIRATQVVVEILENYFSTEAKNK